LAVALRLDEAAARATAKNAAPKFFGDSNAAGIRRAAVASINRDLPKRELTAAPQAR
jgi:hypothetical protein